MDRLIKTIGRLPKVLQNEIWEYVRGDRAYHRQLFEQVVDQINVVIELTESRLFGKRRISQKTKVQIMLRQSKSPGFTPRVPHFVKFQHLTHGQLFADTHQEYKQKASEWTDWLYILKSIDHNF